MQAGFKNRTLLIDMTLGADAEAETEHLDHQAAFRRETT